MKTVSFLTLIVLLLVIAAIFGAFIPHPGPTSY